MLILIVNEIQESLKGFYHCGCHVCKRDEGFTAVLPIREYM